MKTKLSLLRKMIMDLVQRNNLKFTKNRKITYMDIQYKMYEHN